MAHRVFLTMVVFLRVFLFAFLVSGGWSRAPNQTPDGLIVELHPVMRPPAASNSDEDSWVAAVEPLVRRVFLSVL